MKIQNRVVVAAGIAALGFAAPVFADYTYTTLVSFSYTNGADPQGGVTLYGGNLYGTTSTGGIAGGGTVFSLPAAGGMLSTLASFNTSNPSGGSGPKGAVAVSSDGTTLYGTTTFGGSSPGFQGTAFSLPIGGGAPNTLASTVGPGATGNDNLVVSGNTLYGTTKMGGTNLQGTVFSVPTSGGTPTTLATFSGTNGSYPNSSLILSGSTLYGTASNGQGFPGSVFSLPVGGGSPTTLCTFNTTTTGEFPTSGLIISGSTLYGTTSIGPGTNTGTLFSLPIGGGAPTTLATFNGSTPVGNLLLIGATLFGTTQGGGTDNDGTVFSLPVTGGSPTTIYSFTSQNTPGGVPDNLIADSAGDLFGTTSSGGTGSEGSVFELSQAVPEPASVVLLGLGAMGLLSRRRALVKTRFAPA